MWKKIGFCVGVLVAAMTTGALAASAQTADQAWLRYTWSPASGLYPRDVRALGTGVIEQSAVQRTPA